MSKTSEAVKAITQIWKTTRAYKGFSPAINEMVITEACEKKITAEFKVTEDLSNFGGKLHGGAIATIADVISTLGLLCIHNNTRPGVSVNLNINYLSAASIGDDIIIESENKKVGKTLAYLDIVLTKKDTGDIIATASHVKHLGPPLKLPES